MTSTPMAAKGSDYAGLSRLVRAAGLLERTRLRYALRALTTGICFGACWWLLLVAAPGWWSLAVAVALGLASTQIAFLGHDGGHQQIAVSRSGNTATGLVAGNLLTGLSIGWWVDKHNRHHSNPNREDHDPDIGEGVLAFTAAHAASRRGKLARAITRNQAFLFFPLLTLEGLNLHVASVAHLIRARSARLRRTEVMLLSLHTVGYLGVVFSALSPVRAVAFVVVHQAVFGLYMGCSFAPNHKGMPIIAASEKIDYLRRQVLTSRNVRGGWLVNQLLGGLNFQIEHHLFPNMPRANLRHAQPLVREYCALHSIAYTETSLWSSYATALRYLHGLGAPLRHPNRAMLQSRGH